MFAFMSDIGQYGTLFFSFTYVDQVKPSPLVLRSLVNLFYQPWMTDGDD
jgi:hypothetical protein